MYTIKSFASVITDPWIMFAFVIIGVIFYRQNKKISDMQKMIIGQKLSYPLELTVSQIVMGLFAGMAGSILLSYIGVTFSENSSIYLVFLISIFLVFINPKYICFSYSGAIVGLISIIVSAFSSVYHYKVDYAIINIASLMTLVGILHVIEGFLIIFDGRRGAIPVFTNKSGKISGGFAFKRYWALPIMIMLISVATPGKTVATDNIATPAWWPLVKTSLSASMLKNAIITIAPILGAIGYSSITFTQSKMRKTLTSGLLNIIYGIVISFIAQIANMGIAFQLIVVVCVPILHELMLIGSNCIENKLNFKFVSDDEGIVILEVAPYSPAYEMGLKSGDKLLELNGQKISDDSMLSNVSNIFSTKISFKVKRNKGIVEEISYDKMEKNKKLGIVFVPREIPKESVVVKLEDKTFKDYMNDHRDNANNKQDNSNNDDKSYVNTNDNKENHMSNDKNNVNYANNANDMNNANDVNDANNMNDNKSTDKSDEQK